MSEAFDTENLHHLVDRLNPAQARHLCLIISLDSELAPVAEDVAAQAPEGEGSVPEDLLALIGSVDSGRTDRSENVDSYIRDRLHRRRQQFA